MRFKTLAVVTLTLALICTPAVSAQDESALRVAPLLYSGQVVPGEIMELRVEGLGERFTSPPPGGALQVLVTQDGATQAVAARTATPVFVREVGAGAQGGEAAGGMKAYQSLSFVVPRGRSKVRPLAFGTEKEKVPLSERGVSDHLPVTVRLKVTR